MARVRASPRHPAPQHSPERPPIGARVRVASDSTWRRSWRADPKLCETCHEEAERSLTAIRRMAGLLTSGERAALEYRLEQTFAGVASETADPPVAKLLERLAGVRRVGPRAARWKMFDAERPRP